MSYYFGYFIYEEIVNERFKRDHNFEITYVWKEQSYNYACMGATSPHKIRNIRKNTVIFCYKCIDITKQIYGIWCNKIYYLSLIAKILYKLKYKNWLKSKYEHAWRKMTEIFISKVMINENLQEYVLFNV